MPDRSIFDAIRLHRLAGDDGPADLDWRQLAGLLAEQVDGLAKRLDGAPGTTDADAERVARAASALKQYHAARAELDDLT